MDCPSCADPLNAYTHGDLHLDGCLACRGVWLDPGELKPFIQLLLRDYEYISELPLDQVPQAGVNADEEPLACPLCGRPMEKLNYAYDSNIILDRCTECEGLWVEGNEVKLLASFTKGNPKLRRLSEALAGLSEDREQVFRIDSSVSRIARFLNIIVPVPWPWGGRRFRMPKK